MTVIAIYNVAIIDIMIDSILKVLPVYRGYPCIVLWLYLFMCIICPWCNRTARVGIRLEETEHNRLHRAYVYITNHHA